MERHESMQRLFQITKTDSKIKTVSRYIWYFEAGYRPGSRVQTWLNTSRVRLCGCAVMHSVGGPNARLI